MERASRFRRPLAVLMLDVDLFKKVNDTYGHARGDAVLRELAHRLAEQVREVDVLARYGGEEFTVVLPETDRGGAEKLARRILEAVRNLPFSDGGPPLQVTVSIGVAIYPQHGQSPAVLLRAADEALYLAKAQGRDQAAIAAV
ncbi:MAG: GGDEF domain-containing protein [Actinomycetes bacterium]